MVFTPYKHDINNSQSISNDYVTSICEDNNGYLWIGTQQGLNKLDVDGMVFTPYKHDVNNSQSICHDYVYSVYKDIEGNLWIGTANGINTLNFRKQAFKYNDGISLVDGIGSVLNICSDDAKILWLKSEGGLIKYDSQNHTVLNIWPDIFTQQKLSRTRTNTFCISADGCLWSGTDNFGLQRFNPKTNELTTYIYEEDNKNCINSNTIYSLFAGY